MTVEEYILLCYSKQEENIIAHIDEQIEEFKEQAKHRRAQLVSQAQ